MVKTSRFDQPLIDLLEASNVPYTFERLQKLKAIISTQTFTDFSPKSTLNKLKGIAQKFEFHSQNAKLKLMKRMIEQLEEDQSEVALKCCLVFLELAQKPLEQDLLLLDVADYSNISLDLDESSEDAPFTGEHWQTEKISYEDSLESESSDETEYAEENFNTIHPLVAANRYNSTPVDFNGWNNPNNLYWKRPAYNLQRGVIKHFATEFDLVREVLFILNGSTSTIFELQDGVVVYKHVYSLKHLSDGALEFIMTKFASLANEMQVVIDYANCSNLKSNTIQAFQAAVLDIVQEIRGIFLELEAKFKKRTRDNPELFIRLDDQDDNQDFANSLDTVSLIWLHQKVERLLLPIKICERTIKAVKIAGDKEPETISCFLLNHLYNLVCQEQEMGREMELQTCFEILIKSMMPLMNIIGASFSSRCGAWADYKEFFLRINPACYDTKDSAVQQLDWSSCCTSVDGNCPEFVQPFLKQFVRAFRSCLMMDNWFQPAENLAHEFICSFLSVSHCTSDFPSTLASMDTCLLDYTPLKSTEVKMEFKRLSNTIEPFESRLLETLRSVFKPILAFADSKMKSFLLTECKVQDSIIGLQRLCFFLYGGITNSFCDRVLLLPASKLKSRWMIQKCLVDSANDGNLGLNLDLLEIELNPEEDSLPFNGFKIVYKAPWPLNQLLSPQVQNRYNKVFKFLALIYHSNKCIQNSKSGAIVTTERLYLSSFISSLGSFFMNFVIQPLSKRSWEECANLDELFTMHESMISDIETKLFLNHPGIHKSLLEMIKNCQTGLYDHDLALFLHDAMLIDGQDWFFPLLSKQS